ncbi:hypothetical protein [Amycolatopsis aidingensis]|uniref:hypothetical protein n=1 Tax=Amycolatopsis aidingensis TaxID=2842453 RepID=UPI001C0E1417|nr:hypothetical protein [Amycolatopsis aidingensis]
MVPRPSFRLLACAGALLAASCTSEPPGRVSDGVTAGLDALPSTPTEVSATMHELARLRCSIVSETEVQRLLEENISQQIDKYSSGPGMDQLTCRWVGSSPIPGRDRGVHGRSLTLHANIMLRADDPEGAAARFFRGKFVSRGGWERTDLAGADRAALHRPRAHPEVKTLSIGFQVGNVLVRLSHDDAGSTQQRVEDETFDLAKRLIARLR